MSNIITFCSFNIDLTDCKYGRKIPLDEMIFNIRKNAWISSDRMKWENIGRKIASTSIDHHIISHVSHKK